MVATLATVSTVATASFSSEADGGSRSSKVSLLESSMTCDIMMLHTQADRHLGHYD